MKALLVFPPWFNPTQPYLGLLELRSVLQAATPWEVSVFDWGVESYRTLLDPAVVRSVASRCGTAPPTAFSNELRNVLDALRQPDEAYRGAVATIDRVFDWYTACFPLLRLWRYCGLAPVGWSLSSSADLLRFSRQEEGNVFSFLYQQLVEPRLSAARYEAVGVSLVCPDQLPAAATLAARMRRDHPTTRLVLGGPLATVLERRRPRPRFLDYFDAVYSGAARADVVAAFTGAHDREPSHRQLPSWPAATWDGVDLGRYIAPSPVLPVRASAGCTWGCRFCSSPVFALAVEGTGFRFRGAEPIVDEMAAHVATGRATRFLLVGEMLAWTQARAVARSIQRRGLDRAVRWYFWTRTSPRPPAGVPELLAACGCRRICFGVETLSELALRRANKASRPGDTRSTLRGVVAAGIQPHLYLMTGLPSQRREGADRLLEDFVSELVEAGATGLTATVSPFERELLSPWGRSGPAGGAHEAPSPPPDCDLALTLPASPAALAHAGELRERLAGRLASLPYLGAFGNVHQLVFLDPDHPARLAAGRDDV